MTPQYYFATALVALIGVFVVIISFAHPRTIRAYWHRSCTGRAWTRTFPQASKGEIRKFLYLFVEAFAFPPRRALQFAPTDRVFTVYRSLYPIKNWPDALELETFSLRLEKAYRMDLRAMWRENLTLGEIFSKIQNSRIETAQHT